MQGAYLWLVKLLFFIFFSFEFMITDILFKLKFANRHAVVADKHIPQSPISSSDICSWILKLLFLKNQQFKN